MPGPARKNAGFTLIELLVALALASAILLGTSGLVNNVIKSEDVVSERNNLQQDARFAMARIVTTTSHSRKLLLPLADNPNTNWPENIREQTIPASAPVGNSTFATAVLAVTLPEYVDLDADGFPDADDDRDGRIDEDLPNDVHHDFYPGIMGIDDDGDGSIDEGGLYWDDEEDGSYNEDPIDGIDNDGDGAIDEDPASDTNGDGCPGICGVDDDGNGTVDGTSDDTDDDEQGSGFEDGYDPVVFYLNGDSLIERMPAPWNTDGNSSPDGPVDGRDFIESVIAENVTRFRVERPIASSSGKQLVEVTLELTGPTGIVVNLSSQVRIGSAQ